MIYVYKVYTQRFMDRCCPVTCMVCLMDYLCTWDKDTHTIIVWWRMLTCFCVASGLTALTLLSLPLSLSFILTQCSRSLRTPAPAPSSLRSSPRCRTSSSATAAATCSPETTWLPKSGTSTWRASPWRHTRWLTTACEKHEGLLEHKKTWEWIFCLGLSYSLLARSKFTLGKMN